MIEHAWELNSFICEYCGTLIEDGPDGYVTECEHYRLPKEFKPETTKGFSMEISIDKEKVLDINS